MHPPHINLQASKQTMTARSRSKAIPLLVLLFISNLCLYFPVTTEAATESDAVVDLLYLTLKWPGTFCHLGKCCMPPTGEPAGNFLIEDFKTYDSRTGHIVENCNATCSFSVNKMRNLIGDLYLYWNNMSCTCDNGKESWKRTWCTYGQCSILNQYNYTQAALNISALANLIGVFEVNGIVPTYSKSYKLGDIKTALRANLSLSTHIECVKETFVILERTLLSKIHICVSPDGKHFIDCPFTIRSTCNDDVWIYPFNSNELDDCHYDDFGSGGLLKMAIEKDLAM